MWKGFVEKHGMGQYKILPLRCGMTMSEWDLTMAFVVGKLV
jgi:hypothetical protein